MIKFTNDDAKRISFMIDTIGRFFEEKQQMSPDTELKEVYNDDDVYSHPEQFYIFIGIKIFKFINYTHLNLLLSH